MGRRKREGTTESGERVPCGGAWCLHGGRCAGAGRGCACAAAWGGPACARYLGHDHACRQLCAPPLLCVWGADRSETEVGTPYCVCPEGADCGSAARGAGAGAGARGGGGAGGAWLAAVLTLLTLAALVLAVLYLIHRRRQGMFPHARLADNVEISNPMYLAGEDDEPDAPDAPDAPRSPRAPHVNGANHFANPVYESIYTQHTIPKEEHANLLSEAREGSPPPVRALL